MTYSLYFLFSENNYSENNITKAIFQNQELTVNNQNKITVGLKEPASDAPEENITKNKEYKEDAFTNHALQIKKNNGELSNANKSGKNEEVSNDSINEMKNINLYEPIYDEGIIRSSAKAYFHLQDARSRPLEPKIVVKVKVWRNIKNDLWLEEDAVYNHQKSMIECEGVNRQGLEPGYYSVEVDGGGYGVLKFKFGLKKNEELFSTHIMPNYSKVIVVQFVDCDGKNAKYTRSYPVYKWNANVAPFSEYESQKYLVLKNTPNCNRTWFTYGGSHSVTRGCGGPRDYVYQPEDGRYYIRVFSGQEGQINYEYRENEGPQIPYFLESKFDDKLDSLVIQLKEPPIIKEKTSVYIISKSLNNEFIGYNANTITVESSTQEEKFDYSLKGISYQIKDSKFPLQLEYIIGSHKPITLKGDGFLFQQNFDRYFTESEISVRLVDKKIFKSAWEKISLEEGIVSFKELKFNLKEFKVNIPLSPTFLEMAKDFSSVTSENNSFDLQSNNKSLSFSSLFNLDDKLFEENLSELNFSIKSNVSIDKAINGTFKPIGYLGNQSFYEEPLLLSSNEIIESVNHEVEISLIQKTLILRAIDNSDSGLPWVEASLVSFEDLSIAGEIQMAFKDSSNNQFLEGLANVAINDSVEMLTNSEITVKLKSIFPKEDVLKYFYKNGTWYNAAAKGVSDSKGYLILKSEELIPGKKYTLFLWHQTQNDLKPDKKISFIAQKGITDLGAIRFD
jgi:hypothetical protein